MAIQDPVQLSYWREITVKAFLHNPVLSRNDNLEASIGTAMDVGATVLKVGLQKLTESSAPSAVEKVGQAGLQVISTAQLSVALNCGVQVAGPSAQVQAYIAGLTPEQVR